MNDVPFTTVGLVILGALLGVSLAILQITAFELFYYLAQSAG